MKKTVMGLLIAMLFLFGCSESASQQEEKSTVTETEETRPAPTGSLVREKLVLEDENLQGERLYCSNEADEPEVQYILENEWNTFDYYNHEAEGYIGGGYIRDNKKEYVYTLKMYGGNSTKGFIVDGKLNGETLLLNIKSIENAENGTGEITVGFVSQWSMNYVEVTLDGAVICQYETGNFGPLLPE